MATPTTALDDLLGLMTPDEQAIIRATILKNPQAKTALEEGMTMRKEYLSDEPPVVTVPPVVVPPVATVTPPPVAAAGDMSAVLKQLSDLNVNLAARDARIDKLEKNAVTLEKLPEYRTELLGLAIKSSHEVARLESTHEKEFGESLDLDGLSAWIDEQKKAGVGFSSITKAYEAKMMDKRIEKKIADGIAEGVKQKKSSESVPGQSSVTAISAGQELMRKQRGESAGTDHVTGLAAKLAKIREAREAREGGVEAEAS